MTKLAVIQAGTINAATTARHTPTAVMAETDSTATMQEHRQGPRPLSLHLMAALSTAISAIACLPAARAGRMPWHPRLAADAAELTEDMRGADALALQHAVIEEAFNRLRALHAGIQRYHEHGQARRQRTEPEVWRAGTTSLRDYGGGGRPVMFVPSLINRADVLDLREGASLLQWLRDRGLRPLLLDWDSPGPDEHAFDLGDYICRRLEPALDRAVALAGGPLPVVGYCMGGTLAVALATRRQQDISGLALLATPWDFHAEREGQEHILAVVRPILDVVLEQFGELPVDLLQAIFATLDPNLAQRKFARFASRAEPGPAGALFVALEDWLNDGVPLVPAVARECFDHWYGENRPAAKRWRIDDQVVDPAMLKMPALLAIPAADRIVPPAAARALAHEIADVTLCEPAAGHIGMVVGSRAERSLWRPLLDWLTCH